jgi:phenylpyruvate tautomerase PptA (4-oxalocrotonate tautomerase family)
MPMIDAFIPEGALAPDAEARLFEELTEMVIRLDGFDPTSERARAATWIFLHRPTVFVAGARPALPRYRFAACLPEGQYNDDVRRAVIKEVTQAVARAEGRPYEDVAPRVWVFANEIPEGTWGGGGHVLRLANIAGYLGGDQARQAAAERLADRRRATAIAMADGPS